MDIQFVAAILASAVALGIAVLYRTGARQFARTIDQPISNSLEQMLHDLAKNTRDSAVLLRAIEAEISARAVIANELQKKADTAEERASISLEAAEKVERLWRGVVSEQSKAAGRSSFVANILFFICGVFASIAVTLFVTPLAR